MSVRLLDYFYIAGTILFTVYGQLAIKWRIGSLSGIPEEVAPKFRVVLSLLLDPVVISGFIAAFLASLLWIAAMTKFEISYAYPFMSLNFVLVTLLGSMILGETVSLATTCGIGLIVLGTIIASKG